jgi:MarR family transcriptional regulator, organic hydroperoxide resistance regulator
MLVTTTTGATATDELRRLSKQLMQAVRRLRGREAQQRCAMSFAQYSLMRALADGGDQSSGQLAAAAGLTPAATTQMIDYLEREGVVERRRSGEDRRVVVLRLTDEGRRRLEVKHAEIEDRWSSALAGLEDEELHDAARVIDRLSRMLDEL